MQRTGKVTAAWLLSLCTLASACSPGDAQPAGAPAGTAAPRSAAGDARAGASQSSATPRNIPADAIAAAEAEAQFHRDVAAGVRGLIASLLRQDTADAQAAVALLLPLASGDDDGTTARTQIDTAMARAARLAPDDVEIAWLEATLCGDRPDGCDRPDSLARLLALEPDNGANYLGALGDAVARGDDAAIDRLLVAAAAAEHYDERYGAASARINAALSRLALPPRSRSVAEQQGRGLGSDSAPSDDDLRVLYATSVGNAVAMPPFQPLLSACAADVAGARRQACTGLLERMAGGGTLLSQTVATSRLVDLTAGTPAQARWRERYREVLWLGHAGARQPPASAAYWRAAWRIGEVPALRAHLQSRGLALAPDWLPAGAEARARITGSPGRR